MTLLAGGTDLYPATQSPHLTGEILDLSQISELKGITETEDGLRIGASVTWSELIHTSLPRAFDALKAAASEVGSVQIQNVATIAGNLCNASPAADGVPPLLVLDTRVELASLSGRRRLPLSDFILGNRRTALEDGEILVALHVPGASMRGQSAFVKLGARRHLVISIAMVAARLVAKDEHITAAALAVGACSAVAQRLPAAEAALTGTPLCDAAQKIGPDHLSPLTPIDDVRADAAYRRDAALTLCRRATERARAPS